MKNVILFSFFLATSLLKLQAHAQIHGIGTTDVNPVQSKTEAGKTAKTEQTGEAYCYTNYTWSLTDLKKQTQANIQIQEQTDSDILYVAGSKARGYQKCREAISDKIKAFINQQFDQQLEFTANSTSLPEKNVLTKMTHQQKVVDNDGIVRGPNYITTQNPICLLDQKNNILKCLKSVSYSLRHYEKWLGVYLPATKTIGLHLWYDMNEVSILNVVMGTVW